MREGGDEGEPERHGRRRTIVRGSSGDRGRVVGHIAQLPGLDARGLPPETPEETAAREARAAANAEYEATPPHVRRAIHKIARVIELLAAQDARDAADASPHDPEAPRDG
jgi:nucleoid-associated protein YgaU